MHIFLFGEQREGRGRKGREGKRLVVNGLVVDGLDGEMCVYSVLVGLCIVMA